MALCTVSDCVNRDVNDTAIHTRRTTCGRVPLGFTIVGVGPDTDIVYNEAGAGQSAVPYAFHTMPVRAVMSLAQLQAQGDAKYGEFDWRGIPVREHVNHALVHLLAWLAGDRQDNHLQHGAWRALAALEGDEREPNE